MSYFRHAASPIALIMVSLAACSSTPTRPSTSGAGCTEEGPATSFHLAETRPLEPLDTTFEPPSEPVASVIDALLSGADDDVAVYAWDGSFLVAGVTCEDELESLAASHAVVRVTASDDEPAEDDEEGEDDESDDAFDESFDEDAGSRSCAAWLALVSSTSPAPTKRHVVLEAIVGLQQMDDALTEAFELSATDIDSDGREEIVVRWETEGASRPATGPVTTITLAFVDGNTLATRWSADTGSSGASVDPVCEGVVTLLDVNCDGHRDIRLDTHCYDDACRTAREAEDAEEIAEYCGENQLNEDTKTQQTTVWRP